MKMVSRMLAVALAAVMAVMSMPAFALADNTASASYVYVPYFPTWGGAGLSAGPWLATSNWASVYDSKEIDDPNGTGGTDKAFKLDRQAKEGCNQTVENWNISTLNWDRVDTSIYNLLDTGVLCH